MEIAASTLRELIDAAREVQEAANAGVACLGHHHEVIEEAEDRRLTLAIDDAELALLQPSSKAKA